MPIPAFLISMGVTDKKKGLGEESDGLNLRFQGVRVLRCFPEECPAKGRKRFFLT